MIHKVHSTNLVEINRILELIQKDATRAQQTAVTQAQTVKAQRVSAVSTASTVVKSSPTQTVTSGGGVSSLMTGAEETVEVLTDPNGSVLTDENGYALLGVKVSSTIMTGVGDNVVEVLVYGA